MPATLPALKAGYFGDAVEFRRWLENNHDGATELIVGLFKRASGRGGLTYPQALDEALCFGWIDGVRRSDGPEGYTIRFTPRQPGSTWSRVNVRHVERLIATGRMHASGLAVFKARSAARTGIYSFENRPKELPRPLARTFRADEAAWTFWRKQPPGYRRTATWWVVSAKQTATRARRLARLIAESAAGRRLAQLTSTNRRSDE
jgi:uncharacterized protein YdeI (YjbR/CyaY-like superfamily)